MLLPRKKMNIIDAIMFSRSCSTIAGTGLPSDWKIPKDGDRDGPGTTGHQIGNAARSTLGHAVRSEQVGTDGPEIPEGEMRSKYEGILYLLR